MDKVPLYKHKVQCGISNVAYDWRTYAVKCTRNVSRSGKPNLHALEFGKGFGQSSPFLTAKSFKSVWRGLCVRAFLYFNQSWRGRRRNVHAATEYCSGFLGNFDYTFPDFFKAFSRLFPDLTSLNDIPRSN